MTKTNEENRPCSHREKFSMKTVGDEDGNFLLASLCECSSVGSFSNAQPQIDNGNVTKKKRGKKHKTIYKEKFFFLFCTRVIHRTRKENLGKLSCELCFFFWGSEIGMKAHFKLTPLQS